MASVLAEVFKGHKVSGSKERYLEAHKQIVFPIPGDNSTNIQIWSYNFLKDSYELSEEFTAPKGCTSVRETSKGFILKCGKRVVNYTLTKGKTAKGLTFDNVNWFSVYPEMDLIYIEREGEPESLREEEKKFINLVTGKEIRVEGELEVLQYIGENLFTVKNRGIYELVGDQFVFRYKVPETVGDWIRFSAQLVDKRKNLFVFSDIGKGVTLANLPFKQVQKLSGRGPDVISPSAILVKDFIMTGGPNPNYKPPPGNPIPYGSELYVVYTSQKGGAASAARSREQSVPRWKETQKFIGTGSGYKGDGFLVVNTSGGPSLNIDGEIRKWNPSKEVFEIIYKGGVTDVLILSPSFFLRDEHVPRKTEGTKGVPKRSEEEESGEEEGEEGEEEEEESEGEEGEGEEEEEELDLVVSLTNFHTGEEQVLSVPGFTREREYVTYGGIPPNPNEYTVLTEILQVLLPCRKSTCVIPKEVSGIIAKFL